MKKAKILGSLFFLSLFLFFSLQAQAKDTGISLTYAPVFLRSSGLKVRSPRGLGVFFLRNFPQVKSHLKWGVSYGFFYQGGKGEESFSRGEQEYQHHLLALTLLGRGEYPLSSRFSLQGLAGFACERVGLRQRLWKTQQEVLEVKSRFYYPQFIVGVGGRYHFSRKAMSFDLALSYHQGFAQAFAKKSNASRYGESWAWESWRLAEKIRSGRQWRLSFGLTF